MSNKDQKQTVLIVEDEELLNEAFSIALNSEGFNVLRASNGKEALEFVDKVHVDVILLDLLMPVMDGKEFLEHYKRLEIENKSKIIAFSNMDLDGDIQIIYKLGVDRYILKSWATPKELIRVIKETLDA